MTLRLCFALLVCFVASGCEKSSHVPPQRPAGEHVVASAHSEGADQICRDRMPGSRPVRLHGPIRQGERLTYSFSEVPDTLRNAPFPLLRQWVMQSFVLDLSTRDTVFAFIECLRSFLPGALLSTSQGSHFLLRRGIVAFWSAYVPAATAGPGMLSLHDVRIRCLPFGTTKNLLVVRTDVSPRPAGNEQYRIFGISREGILTAYDGPMEYVKDGDLPGSLRPGQVSYAYIRIGCIRVPLPLTFEPEKCRFVAEVGEDALFPASGEGAFTGGRDSSEQIRLFSSYGQGASSLQASIPLRSKVTVRKAYLPWFIHRKSKGNPGEIGWVYIEVNNLTGWIPDSLYQRTGLAACK